MDTESPFVLSNLLAAGTVALGNLFEWARSSPHTYELAGDGWSVFVGTSVSGYLSNTEDRLFCKQLDFLIKHEFVSATFLHAEKFIFVRIYLIPYDLAKVQGRLRVRKETVKAPARRYLRYLFPKLIRNMERWNGYETPDTLQLMFPESKDARTLSEIYGDLSSPRPQITPGWENITRRFLDFEDNLAGIGMRSTLYKYQRRSVAAMMQKELDLRDIPDPLFVRLISIDGKVFYLQPGTMEVLQERPVTSPCRGGILCEELGTGKTVMILTLVLATLNQLSTPEDSIVDDRPVLTPLALRSFPSSTYAEVRQRLVRGKRAAHQDETIDLPSLVEILLHRSRVMPDTSIPDLNTKHGVTQYNRRITFEDYLESVPIGKLRRANVPFYYHYPGEPFNYERSQRRQLDRGPRIIYVTSATLIVVPSNLLSQWDREIVKHCESPLRLLIVRAKTEMPSVQSLASDYDIILMSYHRFIAEAGRADISKLHSWKPCLCPCFKGSRLPDCRCSVSSVSPFLQIRWKRLVIDEGHVSSVNSSTLISFTKQLSVERRWIVSGTPTTNLLGLGLGQQSSPTEPSEVSTSREESEDEISFTTDSAKTPQSPAPSLDQQAARIWNKYDREDINKLGNMITHFISIPQFVADPKLVLTNIVEPLLDPCGPRAGSIQVLTQVMENIMVRHRIEDVEIDVILPPVTHESILLDLDPLMVKSYNALQASIAINAIDSQRIDLDYMFHPRNTEYLQLTVQNMSQVMFWSVDETMYNVKELNARAEGFAQRAKERNVSDDDMKLLTDAFRHIELAAQDQLWRDVQGHEDILYQVYNMDQRVYKAWSSASGNIDPRGQPLVGFLRAGRLLRLRDAVICRPLISVEDMVIKGYWIDREDRANREYYEQSLKKKKKSSGIHSRHNDDTPPSHLVENSAKKASAPETLKEMQKELDESITLLDSPEDLPTLPEGSSTSLHSNSVANAGLVSRLIANSPLAKVIIGSSASTKLNYIINDVLKYSSTEKFLIFSDSQLSLAHIAEALELIQVKFLRFTTSIQSQFREQLVLTFETSETYRVFLMELKHGARGLNLISASRVIFCEPVWQADVESQAIKRAHRIGQTKHINVKSLAIRGTAEEKMVERREALKSTRDKQPKLIEETGMRHYIANPIFIEHPPSHKLNVEFPLIRLPPSETQQNPNMVTIRLPAFEPQSSGTRITIQNPLKSLSLINNVVPSESETPPPMPEKRVRIEDHNIDSSSTSAVVSEPPKKKHRSVRFE